MTANHTYAEIHIHGVDGYMAAFAQNDAETFQRQIKQLQPGWIFTQSHLTIAGRRSLTVFPAAQVVRVDLVMSGFPDWPFHRGIADAAELTVEEFRLRVSAVPDTLMSPPGTRSVCAEIEMTNGERIYLEIHVRFREESLTRVDFVLLLQHLLASPSFHARRLGGGAVVLNPAHFLRVQFHPAPSQCLPNAWSADPITERADREWGGHGSPKEGVR